MASEYQLVAPTPGSSEIVLRLSDGAFIPADPGNRDYQAYLAWQAEGNQADPASPPSPEVQAKEVPGP